MIKFKEYLTEGIGPIKTDYGLNDEADDGKIKDNDHTYFIHDGVKYEVDIFEYEGMGEVTFASLEDSGLGRTGKGQALQVIGRVFYIATKIAKKAGWDTLVFTGNDAGLQKLYARMVNNEVFKKAIKKLGFDVTLKDEDFIMKKARKKKK